MYVCLVGRALTELARRARADTVAEIVKRMMMRVEADVGGEEKGVGEEKM